MKQFEMIIPVDFLMFPFNQHYDQSKAPIKITVSYRCLFDKVVEVLSLEVPYGAWEMLALGAPLNAYIHDAAYNNWESEKEEKLEDKFDGRLKAFVNGL